MLAPLFRTVLAVATLAAGDYVSSATLPMTTRTPAALEPAFVQPGARGVLGNLNPGLHLRRDGVCSLSCHGMCLFERHVAQHTLRLFRCTRRALRPPEGLAHGL
jgi:hypothetical protein